MSTPETVTYREAINRALRAAMEADENVILLGEDIGAAGGSFKLTEGLQETFGPERVMDTPDLGDRFRGRLHRYGAGRIPTGGRDDVFRLRGSGIRSDRE